MSDLVRRSWTPDIEVMAQQLIDDVRDALNEKGYMPQDRAGYAFEDAVGVFGDWEQQAAAHGEEIQPDDYQALAILLATKVLGYRHRNDGDGNGDE